MGGGGGVPRDSGAREEGRSETGPYEGGGVRSGRGAIRRTARIRSVRQARSMAATKAIDARVKAQENVRSVSQMRSMTATIPQPIQMSGTRQAARRGRVRVETRNAPSQGDTRSQTPANGRPVRQYASEGGDAKRAEPGRHEEPDARERQAGAPVRRDLDAAVLNGRQDHEEHEDQCVAQHGERDENVVAVSQEIRSKRSGVAPTRRVFQ